MESAATDMDGGKPERRRGLRRLLGPLLGLAARLPYGPLSRGLGWLYGQRLLQATIFAPGLAYMARGLAPYALPEPDRHQGALFLATNWLMPWRVKALGQASREEFAAWVEVSGASHLSQALAEGRGVILAGMHYGAARLVPLVVSRLGHTISILAPLGYLAKMGVDNAGRVRILTLPEDDQLWLRPTLQACSALGRGEIVGVVADGLQGGAGRERAFLGLRRRFQVGFAELASRTGARVVPVVARMAVDGRISIHFHPPLRDDPGQDHEGRIQGLLGQFLDILAEEWRRAPGGVLRRQFRAVVQGPSQQN